MTKAAPACGLVLLAGAALLAGSAGAQDAALQPVPEEFVRLFSSYCLQKFPVGVSEQALADHLEPMSAAQTRTVLRKDTGTGWVVKGKDIQYVLTIEQPPLQTCSLRRVSDHAMTGGPLIDAARSFVEHGGHKLLPPVGHARPMAQGQISNSQILQELDEKNEPLPQAYMYFVVTYPAVAKGDGSFSKPFYEIRFTRQMYRQQT
jgi:hypothetical protein